MKRKDLTLLNTINVVLLLAGVVCLLAGIINLIQGRLDVAGTGLTAGLLFLFGASIDRFESLKGLGLEAKTRVLDSKIDEAEKILTNLRNLAEIAGGTLIALSAKAGRWSGAPTVEENYNLAMSVKSNLRNLDCSEISIRESLAPWVKVNCIDVSMKLVERLQETAHEVMLKNNALIAQMSANPIQPDDLVYQGATAKNEQVGQFQQTLRQVHLWPVEETNERLAAALKGALNLDPLEREALEERFERWYVEISWLIENQELKTKDLWFRELRRSKD